MRGYHYALKEGTGCYDRVLCEEERKEKEEGVSLMIIVGSS